MVIIIIISRSRTTSILITATAQWNNNKIATILRQKDLGQLE